MSRLAIIGGDPVTSLEALITIRIEFSVFYLLARYSIFLAIFFVGQTLGGVKRAGVCTSDHHALSGGSRSYLRGQGPKINISLHAFARILIYFTNPTSVYILYARSGAFAIRLLLTNYALSA